MRWMAVAMTVTFLAVGCSSDDSAEPPDTIVTTVDTADSTTTTTSTTSTDAPTTSTEPDATSSTSSTTSTSERATSTSTTSASTTPQTTAAPGTGGLALTEAGVGPLQFGARPEAAIEFLSGVLGLPTSDSGWGSSFSFFGTCPGTEVRGVSFGPLTVLFGDPDGDREFYAWTYDAFTSPDLFGLATSAGIPLGATEAEVLAAYEGAEIVPADEPLPPSAQLDGIFANFDDSGRVAFLGGGRLCGE